ncbi:MULTISPECIES: IclR family transcriptional regulator [Cupriavidus]|nr:MULTISPECIES: IclR family transcriptional regulator C-terminal domain-containing protein [Cupriavidus]QYY29458.1 helix-turn-helix domain-containing protein [Cupriavidus pinatubonensis]TPQ44150.1 HTH domain-containing protein [Cupriavidus pinatubonensis]
MATDRALGVLTLFSLDKPMWTVDEIGEQLGVSSSSAYRYLSNLLELGLVASAGAKRYVLGPAIIQLDRQIQLTDPMLQAARPVMAELVDFAPSGSVMLLCRAFGDSVLCVHQVLGKGPQPIVSYERGRPMLMFRGATSRIILAFQQTRMLQAIYEKHHVEIAAAGLGDDWSTFRLGLSRLRRMGYAVSHGEIDPGRVGIAAPILGEDGRAAGSLSYVVAEASVDQGSIARLSHILMGAAHEISISMLAQGKDGTSAADAQSAGH